jgi:hypothetical protein
MWPSSLLQNSKLTKGGLFGQGDYDGGDVVGRETAESGHANVTDATQPGMDLSIGTRTRGTLPS